MARRYSFNSLAGSKRSSTSVVDGDTTAGRFDSNYVANALKVPGNGTEYFDTMPFMTLEASVTSHWHRFDHYGSFAANGIWLQAVNASGVVVFQIKFTSGTTAQASYWNGSSLVNTGTGPAMGGLSAAVRTFTLQITCGASGSFTLYSNGSVFDTGAIASANMNNIAYIRTYGTNGTSSFYSQVMGADYDIRDAHFGVATITGNSAANTDGTGAYTDVNEAVLDESTSIALATVGHQKGQTKGSVTVAPSLGVAGVVVNARGRVSGGTVSDGKLGVRSGTSETSSSGRGFNGGYEPRGAIIEADPATGAAWSVSAANSAEPYEEAA